MYLPIKCDVPMGYGRHLAWRMYIATLRVIMRFIDEIVFETDKSENKNLYTECRSQRRVFSPLPDTYLIVIHDIIIFVYYIIWYVDCSRESWRYRLLNYIVLHNNNIVTLLHFCWRRSRYHILIYYTSLNQRHDPFVRHRIIILLYVLV